MKGFTHEKARNTISDFRYFFYDSRDHIADRYNTIFIGKSLVSNDIRDMYSKQNQTSSQRDLRAKP